MYCTVSTSILTMKCTNVVVDDSAVELAYPSDVQAVESKKANLGVGFFAFMYR